MTMHVIYRFLIHNTITSARKKFAQSEIRKMQDDEEETDNNKA